MNALSLYRLIPVVLLAALLASCSDDDGVSGGYVAPPVLQFDRDTLYGTTEDAVLFEASILGTPATQERLLTFGDGGQKSNPEIGGSAKIAVPHVYTATGIYTAVLTAGTDYVDTCIVVVQDYTRPANAQKVTVTITGLEFTYNLKTHFPDNPAEDTTEVSTETSFEVTIAPGELDMQPGPLPWEHRQSFAYTFLEWPEEGTGDSTIYNAYVTLSPNGRAVAHIAIISDIIQMEDSVEVSTETMRLEISGIPLDESITPSINGATYTWSGTADELESYFNGLVYDNRDYSVDPQKFKTLQGYIVTGQPSITVVFEE